jgi:chromosome segregation ATPase
MADDQRRNDERHAQNTEKLDSILDEVRQVKQDVREQNGRVNRLEAFRDEHIERHAQNTEKLDSILDEVRQVKQDVREQNGRVNRLEAFRDEHIAVTAERTKVFMKLTQTIDGMCKEQERVAAELATTKGEVKVRSHITAWIANNSGAIITGIIVGIVILVAKKLGW